jgi:predicted aspartyl protease
VIEGYIDGYGQPRVALVVGGARRARIEAVIDTGFDGDLCLPLEIAIGLGLELKGVMNVELADGTIKRELVFAGTAKLGETARAIRIVLTEGPDPLLGTGMFSYLEIDFGARRVSLRERERA